MGDQRMPARKKIENGPGALAVLLWGVFVGGGVLVLLSWLLAVAD